MDSVVNNLINSWDTVVSETEKKRNSFFNLSNKSSSLHVPSEESNALGLHKQDSNTSIPSVVSNGSTVSGQGPTGQSASAGAGAGSVPRAAFTASESSLLSQQQQNSTATPATGVGTNTTANTITEPHHVFGSSSLFSSSSQITDKLVERIISMALPPSSESQFTQGIITERLEMQKTRPSLSVPIMSRNFILMNSRLSIPFELIDEIIRLASWQNPYYTLAILIIITNLCLNPLLLVLAPILFVMYGIMCPAYLKHHPAETGVLLPSNPIPSRGLPLVNVTTPAPVPELSREFVLNLTDLQNHLLLYVYAYDLINWIVLEFCYFKNEALSASVFLALLIVVVLTSLAFPIVVAFLPVFKMLQVIVVCSIWTIAIAVHPFCRVQILTYCYSEDTRLKILTLTNKVESYVHKQLDYVEEQEIREVEIYEIQYLKPNDSTKNWNFLCYSTDFYAINSESRQMGEPLKGSLSLEKVKAPNDWDFIPDLQSSFHKKNNWKLDLNPKNWVMENNAETVIRIDEDEKWCYDLPLDQGAEQGQVESPTQGIQIRRRRWCRDVIRSFQVDEILTLSAAASAGAGASATAAASLSTSNNNNNDPTTKMTRSNTNEYNNDEKKMMNSNRNSRILLDAQYNAHMKKMQNAK